MSVVPYKPAGSGDGFAQGPQQLDSNPIWPYGSVITNGTTLTPALSFAPSAQGSINSPIRVYDIQPVPMSLTSVAAAQTLAQAGYVTLAQVSGNGVTQTQVSGQAAWQLDCTRTFVITGVAGTTAANFIFYGVDQRLKDVTELVTGPVGANSVFTLKGMAYLLRVYCTAGTTDDISIGVADTFTLPYVSYDRNNVIPIWDGANNNSPTLIRSGTSGALTGGTIIKSSSVINKGTNVFLTENTPNTACGFLEAPTASVVNGVSFTATSSAATEISTLNYFLAPKDNRSGIVTLSGGTVTLLNDNIATNSLIFFSFNDASTPGHITYTIPEAGSAVFTSTNAGDVSTLNYYITQPSLYAGTGTLVLGTATISNTFVSKVTTDAGVVASSIIISRVDENGGTPGFLGVPVATVTNATSFVVNAYNAAAGAEAADVSTFNWMIVNNGGPGILTLADQTDPATSTSGDTVGTFSPSTPSDGFKRLTVYEYVRGTDPVANYVGTLNNIPTLQSTNTSLVGVTQYTDTNF